jgi:hypothetical protein
MEQKKTYSAERWEYLFDKPFEIDGNIGRLNHDDVFCYRVKTIKSGAVCECEVFPIWNTVEQPKSAKGNSTRKAQRDLNRRNSIKKCTRLADTNFTPNDCHITLTYDPKYGLPDEAQARRDIRNYLRRARIQAARDGRELKYIYVIEYFSGDGRRTQVHHHVLLAGLDRNEAERLWTKGRRNADQLQPDNGTLEPLIRYILKSPQSGKGAKRWQGSKNLKKPIMTVADTKITKRQAERLADDIDTAGVHIFGAQFPTYKIDEIAMRRSDFVSGAYCYVKMHKIIPRTKKIQTARRRN